MPADLFRPDLQTTPVRRRASLLPLSIAVHVVVIGAAVLGPLVADTELPTPAPVRFGSEFVRVTPDLPPPPVVALKPPPSTSAHTTSPDKPPIEAPAEIKPETAIERFGNSSPGIDEGDGSLLGIDGSVGAPVAALPPPPPSKPSGPLRVGGQIEAPRRLRSVAPVYPVIAQQARVQGEVVIEAVIGEDGRVRETRVVTGKPMLVGAALDAVKQWTFTPTKLNGEPVAVVMTVTVVFQLN